MDKETLLALFTLLGGIFATVKMLLNAYFKKSEELEETRRANNVRAIEYLEGSLSEHSKLINLNTSEIRLINDKMTVLSKKLTETSEESMRLALAVQGFKTSSDSKLAHIESEFKKLSEVLAIIRTRKPQA